MTVSSMRSSAFRVCGFWTSRPEQRSLYCLSKVRGPYSRRPQASTLLSDKKGRKTQKPNGVAGSVPPPAVQAPPMGAIQPRARPALLFDDHNRLEELERVVRLGDHRQHLEGHCAPRFGGKGKIGGRGRPRAINQSRVDARAQRLVEVEVSRAQPSVVDPKLRTEPASRAIIDVERESALIDEHRRHAEQFESVRHPAGARARQQRPQRRNRAFLQMFAQTRGAPLRRSCIRFHVPALHSCLPPLLGYGIVKKRDFPAKKRPTRGGDTVFLTGGNGRPNEKEPPDGGSFLKTRIFSSGDRHSAGVFSVARAISLGTAAGGNCGALEASAFWARINVSRIVATLRSLVIAAPVPAGMSRPTMTFSFRPSSVSTLPLTAASVRTRVVSWKDAAEMNERVCRLALVMPSRTGVPVASFLPSAFMISLADSSSVSSICSPGRKSVSPGSTISTFCSI